MSAGSDVKDLLRRGQALMPRGASGTLRGKGVIRFFVYSNIYISLAGAGMAITTMLLADFPLDIIPVFVPFAGAMLIYNLNRITDRDEDEVNVPQRAAFARRYGKPLLTLSAVLYLVGVWLAVSRNLATVAFTLLPVAGGILYSVFGAKRVLLAKNLIVGVSWGTIPLLVGAYFGALRTPGVLFLFAFVSTSFFRSAMLFDIKDIEGDKREGVHTVPNTFGVEFTKRATHSLNLLLAASVVLLILLGILSREFLVLLVFHLYVTLFTLVADRDRSALFYGFIVDGECLFLTLTVLVVSLLPGGDGVPALVDSVHLFVTGASVVYLGSTSVALVAAMLCLRHAWKNDSLIFYGTALVYGIILEKAAITAFETYSYPADRFMLSVFKIPIDIGLAWIAIIYAAYITAERLGFEKRSIPIFAGVYVLHIDVAIDAIAIRVPFWIWSLPGTWFGVPLGNFMAWYLVAFLFVGAYLLFEDRIAHPVLLSLSVLLSATTMLVLLLQVWVLVTGNVLYREIVLLLAVFLPSLVVLVRSGIWNTVEKKALPWEPFAAILIIHLFYLGVLLSYGYYRDVPALLHISVGMIGVGIGIHGLPHWPAIKHRLKLGPQRRSR